MTTSPPSALGQEDAQIGLSGRGGADDGDDPRGGGCAAHCPSLANPRTCSSNERRDGAGAGSLPVARFRPPVFGTGARGGAMGRTGRRGISPARVAYGVDMGVFARLLRRSKTDGRGVNRGGGRPSTLTAEAPAEADSESEAAKDAAAEVTGGRSAGRRSPRRREATAAEERARSRSSSRPRRRRTARPARAPASSPARGKVTHGLMDNAEGQARPGQGQGL